MPVQGKKDVGIAPQSGAALNDLGLCLAREGKLEPSLQVLEQVDHASLNTDVERGHRLVKDHH